MHCKEHCTVIKQGHFYKPKGSKRLCKYELNVYINQPIPKDPSKIPANTVLGCEILEMTSLTDTCFFSSAIMYHMKSYKLMIHVNSALSKKSYQTYFKRFFLSFSNRQKYFNFATCGSLVNIFWFGICKKVKIHI